MKNYIVSAFIAILGVSALALPAGQVAAYNPLDGACTGGASNEVCKNKDEKLEPILGTIINTLLYIVGAISVVMVIFAGIMYAISSGDSGRVSKAKNMLTYAIVGLIVSLIAFALVNWVFNLFK